MAKKSRRPKPAHAVFAIRFTEGLATRNRLPLDHVIRVLQEIKGMLESAGKQVERSRGVANPTGDFGLELVGGFQKGSVKAALAITKNVEAGVIAAGRVLDAVTSFSGPATARARRTAEGPKRQATSDVDPRVVARLGNISKVQEIDKTVVEMKLIPRDGKAKTAVFDRQTTQVLKKLREPNFAVEALTVYGKLRELRDKYDDDEDAKKTFFGELVGDDGQVWRIEFKPGEVQLASALFRKQVFVTGNASYYKALNPKIVATAFGADEERDYEAAFNEMYGAIPELAKIDLKTLVGELETD